MKTVPYRSFLVRVWSRQGRAARALLEEVQSGAKSELRGERAERLVAVIDDSLSTPGAGEPRDERAAVGSVEGDQLSEPASGSGHGEQEVWS